MNNRKFRYGYSIGLFAGSIIGLAIFQTVTPIYIICAVGTIIGFIGIAVEIIISEIKGE